MNQGCEINDRNRSGKAEEEQARVKEEECLFPRDEKATTLRTYCLLGLAAVIILLAARMHWTAFVLGLLASFFWPLAARKNRISALILGIVGYLAIPAPFIPLILRHPYLAGIPIGIALVFWVLFSRSIDEDELKLEQTGEELEDMRRSDAWAILVRFLPLFSKWCDWSKFDGGHWAFLLGAQPQFAEKCDFAMLDGSYWSSLLQKQPQFAEKCDFAMLDGSCWSSLLQKQPQFADKCDWEKLDGRDWMWLLGEQPQFADKCDWSKLDNEDWCFLLEKQPQFKAMRGK